MPELTESQNAVRQNDNVQSLIFERSIYNKKDVKVMTQALGYNFWYIDTTDRFYRVRQFNPGSFRSRPKYKNIRSTTIPGVEYVIEY